ncbi:hypothetical protein EV177_000027 [Coemansia sp. RSA 1804]|nr:hypothetical protein EV177_000027 [Coemansia sp. RSA 1804]
MHDKRDSIDTSGLITSSTNSESAKEQRSTTMALPDYSHDRRQSGDGRDNDEEEEYARRRSVMREGSLDSEISSSIDAKGMPRSPGIGSSTSMAAAAAAVADAVARSNISSRGSGAQRLVSPADISHQAQYTFSSPSPSMHRTPPLTNRTLPYQPSPSFSQQMVEDVQMSESPSIDDGDSEFQRDSHGLGGNLSDSGLFRHHSTSRRMQERQMSLNPSRSSTSPLEGDDDSPEAHEGVSMTAKSAVLYHAGYNSGRGAVWRFFKVVESRVSGNTDRAECLLCQKRMLGKSADMKKHIVHSCPKKCNISEDMLPILKIVKSELENPKKRAKRNSNTPMVMRADGSFGPAPSASSTSLADSALVTSRIHTVSGAPSTSRSQQHFLRPSPYDTQFDVQRAKMAKYSRGPMHHGGSGGSRMDEAAPGGSGREHGSHYPSSMHGHQSHSPMQMQMAPPAHMAPNPQQIRQSPPVSSRLQSPIQPSGFSHRHPGHSVATARMQQQQQSLPLLLPPPPPRAASPNQTSTPGSAGSQSLPSMPHHRHTSHPQSSQPQAQKEQEQQPPVRYYPPAAQAGPAHALPHQAQQQQPHHQYQQQHPQHHTQYGHPQRANPAQPPPPPPHGMPLSQTPSPRAMPVGAQFSRFKGRLQQRIPLHGVWLSIPSPVTARMLATQGFDWACIDMEHAPTNPALMAEMVAAVASSGTCAPIVRVPSHSSEWFKWALDAGAYGVIVPMVNTPDEMRRAEQLCRYPPAGRRSMGAFYAPHAFGLRGPRAMADYVEQISGDIVVIPQIESAEGVANLPDILKTGGMDAVFVGPYDLSASVRTTHDLPFQEALGRIERVARDYDVPVGIYASSGAAAWAKMKDGYTLLVAASDIECLSSSAAENLDRARGEPHAYR